MSNKKTLEQMSTTEAKLVGITSLADRPNDASRYGGGGLSAAMLKERFDALPNLVREKFNKIAEVLAGADAAKYIGLDGSVGGVDNLCDFLLLFGARGTGQSDKNISDYIETLYDVPLEDADGNKNYSRTLREIVQSIVGRFAAVETGKGAKLALEVADDGKVTVKLLNVAGEVLEEATAGGPAKTAGIADGAVTNGKLAGEAVTTEKIKDGVVTVEKLASKSVSLEKLGDDVSGKIKHLEDSAFEKVSYDALTGVLTFTAKNGKTGSVDLPLELLVKEGRYDEDTKDIVLVLANGGEIRIPFDAYVDKVSEFITELRGSYKDARLEDGHLVFEAHDGSSKEIDLSLFAIRDEVNTALGSLTARDAELEKTDANFERRISNIEQHISGDYFVTDKDIAYIKTVPERACSTAKLLSLGGMTYKCNNLIPFPYQFTEKTTGGVTATVNDDGSITLNGTATDNAFFDLHSKNTDFGLVEGMRYFISDGVNRADAYVRYLSESGNGFYNSSFVYDKALYFQIRVASGTTLTNVTFKPMLNEGSTALPYEPYYEGLRDSKTTEIVSVGVNRFNTNLETTVQSNASYEKISDSENSFKVISNKPATTTSAFYYTSFKCIIGKGVNTIRLSCIATPIGRITQGLVSLTFRDKDGNKITGIDKKGSGNIVFSIENVSTKYPTMEYITIAFYATAGEPCDAGDGAEYSDVMLSFDADVPYTPYKEPISYPIPAEIQAIKGYGKDGFVIDLEKQTSEYEDEVNPLPVPLERLIEVEGGGSLEFVNEYEQAVPSAVKYLLKEDGAV